MAFSEFILRLCVIILVAFFIGLERKLTGHQASFTTTILIAIGSFVFLSVELYVGTKDSRIAANIITGVGFLCSGVIFKHGMTVNGLNTAATLWSTSAISVLIGNGQIREGLLAGGLLILLNVIMHFFDPYIHPIKSAVKVSRNEYDLTVECLERDVKKVRKVLTEDMPDRITLQSLEMDTLTGTKCRMLARVFVSKSPEKTIAILADHIYEKDVISVAFAPAEQE